LSLVQRAAYGLRDEVDCLRDPHVTEDVFDQACSVVAAYHFHSSKIVEPGVALTSGSDMLAIVELEHCRV